MLRVVVRDEIRCEIEFGFCIEHRIAELGSVEEHADVAFLGESAQFLANLGADRALRFLLALLKGSLGLLLFALQFLLQLQAGGLFFLDGLGVGRGITAKTIDFASDRAKFFVQQRQVALGGAEFEFECLAGTNQLFNSGGFVEKLGGGYIGHAGGFNGLDHGCSLWLGS